MYIAYQSSNEFAIHTGISIYSLLDNNRDIDQITIILLSNGIKKEELSNIESIIKFFNRKLIVIDMQSKLKKIQKKYMLENFNNITACIEMLPSEIFSEYSDEVLLIDSDTIVNGSIRNIRPDNFDNYILSAVPNYQFNYNYEQLDIECKKIIDQNGLYFNTGVVLYNLKKWREMNCNEKVINSIKKIKNINYFASQTILNYAIPMEYVHKMSYKFNYFGFLYNKKDRVEIHKYYKLDALDAERDPVVVHYKGFCSRPWFKELNDEYIKLYRNYKKKTPWKDRPLESIFKSEGFKDMSLKNKIKFIIKITLKKFIKI